MTEYPVLEVRGIVKKFGGLTALDSADFKLESGKLNAIIGPNGAGKTTLFNVVTGMLKPNEGRVLFRGDDITETPVHQIARRGLARTLQIKSVFNSLTVAENLWIAVQAHRGVYRPFIDARKLRGTAERVEHLLDMSGLKRLADVQAGTLSYGDVALLEIAIALAEDPRLLLLDEPICGMGPAETEKTVETIIELSKRIDVVIIEHDIEVVFNIADRIVVMAQGKVLAEGTPAEIQTDHRVRSAYLGEPDDA